MTRSEIRATSSLASIFALRMLGLFLILPVFSVHAKSLPGGNNATLVGLALGMYGLTQSFGQIPFGAASDKYGRKKGGGGGGRGGAGGAGGAAAAAGGGGGGAGRAGQG